MSPQTLSDMRAFVSTLRRIDDILADPSRRVGYTKDFTTNLVTFGLGVEQPFNPKESLATDIAMARWYGAKTMVMSSGNFNDLAINHMTGEGYIVNGIVCAGNKVSCWSVIGKHFALQIEKPEQ